MTFLFGSLCHIDEKYNVQIFLHVTPSLEMWFFLKEFMWLLGALNSRKFWYYKQSYGNKESYVVNFNDGLAPRWLVSYVVLSLIINGILRSLKHMFFFSTESRETLSELVNFILDVFSTSLFANIFCGANKTSPLTQKEPGQTP